MKSVPTPDTQALAEAYAHLEFSPHPKLVRQEAPSLEDLVLWSHWARLDARLAEVLVRYLSLSFGELNPLQLWKMNRSAPCPQALAVLIEFAQVLLRSSGAPSDRQEELHAWRDLVVRDIEPAPAQMFFVRQSAPRPDLDQRTIDRSLAPYLQWGFFADEAIALSKLKGQVVTLLGQEQRQKLLKKLIDSSQPGDIVTVNDYMAACGGRVHRRTAERDLRFAQGLRGMGHTQKRRYKKVET